MNENNSDSATILVNSIQYLKNIYKRFYAEQVDIKLIDLEASEVEILTLLAAFGYIDEIKGYDCVEYVFTSKHAERCFSEWL